VTGIACSVRCDVSWRRVDTVCFVCRVTELLLLSAAADDDDDEMIMSVVLLNDDLLD